jgi:cytochrome b
MRKLYVWDPLVRLFHWALVAGLVLNMFVTDPGKTAHRWLGYGVLLLIGLRLIWGLVGPRFARFRSFPPDPVAALGHATEIATGRVHVHEGHSPLGALMVYNLLASCVIIGLTGWMLTTLTWFGVEWVEDLHKAFVTWVQLSAVLHIAAVIFESRRLRVNLPKSMVTGYKWLP